MRKRRDSSSEMVESVVVSSEESISMRGTRVVASRVEVWFGSFAGRGAWWISGDHHRVVDDMVAGMGYRRVRGMVARPSSQNLDRGLLRWCLAQ